MKICKFQKLNFFLKVNLNFVIKVNFKKYFLVAPTDDQLSRYSLFPEIQKLYGHGFEVYALAVNYAGTIIATSCKVYIF